MTEEKALWKPTFVSVTDLERRGTGFNLYAKVLSVKITQVPSRGSTTIDLAEVELGDATGTVIGRFKGEEYLKLLTVGSVIAIRNGIRTFQKGHIEIRIDPFGRITPETTQEIKSVNTDVNITEKVRDPPPLRQNNRDRRQPRGRGRPRGGPRNFSDQDSRPRIPQYDRKNPIVDRKRLDSFGDGERRPPQPRGDYNRGGYGGQEGNSYAGSRFPTRGNYAGANQFSARGNNEGYQPNRHREGNFDGPRENRTNTYGNQRRFNNTSYNSETRNYDRGYNRNYDRGYNANYGRGQDRNYDRGADRNYDRGSDRNLNRNFGTRDRGYDKDFGGRSNNYGGAYERRLNTEGDRRGPNRQQGDRQGGRQNDQDFYRGPLAGNNRAEPTTVKPDAAKRQSQFTNIIQINPGDISLNLRVKIVSVGKPNKDLVPCVLGDESSVANALLPNDPLIQAGKSIVLFGVEARVTNEHIQIIKMETGRFEASKKEVMTINETNNISDKEWEFVS